MLCQMYFMTSSLLNVSLLFPDQFLTCMPSFSLQSLLIYATKDYETSLFSSCYLTPYFVEGFSTFFEKKKKKNEMLRTIAFSLFSNVLTLNLFGKGF